MDSAQQENKIKAIAHDLVDGLGRWKAPVMIHMSKEPLERNDLEGLADAVEEEFKNHKYIAGGKFLLSHSTDFKQFKLQIPTEDLNAWMESLGY